MAVNTVTSLATAAAAGWNVQGSGTNWYAEKPVQCGGKILCCGAASAQLITAMQNNEIHQESHGAHGPKDTTFKGHV